MTNIQFTKWLKELSDDRLRKIAEFVWNEGKRRGWSEFWLT